MKFGLICIMLCVSCGGTIYLPEHSCDFVSRGTCVNIGEYDVKENLFELAVDITIEKMSYFFDDMYMFSKYAQAENLYVEYVADGPYRGAYYLESKEIKIVLPRDSTEFKLCVEKYYVLSHELLHFISDVILNAGKDLSSSHNVPNVFLQWAVNNDKPWTETAELDIYLETIYMCDKLYPNSNKRQALRSAQDYFWTDI